MKLLVVTNLYPPHYHGGYELRCAQVAEALQRAGHDVLVVTTAYGLPLNRWGGIRTTEERIAGVRVLRHLNQYAFPGQPRHRPWTYFRARRELRDARAFLRILRTFRPDVVTWWSVYGVAKMLLPLPRRLGIPDAHWVEHWWMLEEYEGPQSKTAAFWSAFWDGRWAPRGCRWPLRLAGKLWEARARREGLATRQFPLEPCHVSFVSKYMQRLHREGGLDFPSSDVIYGGVPSDRFYGPMRAVPDASAPLRALYVGQLSPDRGLLTAVEALARLRAEVRRRVSLTVAGTGSEEYLERVKARVRALGLETSVSFLGKVPHEAMAQLYREQDVLVFPSVRAEGLPLTMVEAMLAGCAVVTTGSGGAEEIARAADLPTFAGNDPVALAEALGWLADDRAALRAIAERGQQVALREFDFNLMMDRWTETLDRVRRHGVRRKDPAASVTLGSPDP